MARETGGDEIDHLKHWAAASQGIATRRAPDDDILKAVTRIDTTARDAAAGLPFGTEPAGYAQLLEAIADRITPQ